MADGKRWIIGCGSGCGVLLFAAVVVILLAAQRFQRAFSGYDDVRESWDELVTTLGEPDAWTPPLDGSTPSDRIEIFLEVRSRLIAAQAKADSALAAFPPAEFDRDKPWWHVVWHAVGAFADLVPPLLDYADAHNRILLEEGMGLGEYAWIYASAYQGWLGHDPGDVPTFRGDRPRADRVPGEALFKGADATLGAAATRERWRNTILDALRNWLRAVETAGDAYAATERDVMDEIRLLDDDPGRRLWNGAAPAAVAAAFAPYRERLEASYRPQFNAFEMPTDDEFRWEEGE